MSCDPSDHVLVLGKKLNKERNWNDVLICVKCKTELEAETSSIIKQGQLRKW